MKRGLVGYLGQHIFLHLVKNMSQFFIKSFLQFSPLIHTFLLSHCLFYVTHHQAAAFILLSCITLKCKKSCLYVTVDNILKL